MKIFSWNVNSVRARENHLIELIKQFQPDVICLQETKVINNKFPGKRFIKLGYDIYLNGMPSYNGVAILSRLKAGDMNCIKFCNKEDARHISVILGKYQIHSIYVPSGGDIPDLEENVKFKHKLEFVNEVSSRIEEKKNQILCGDLNIAPRKDDVWSHKSLLNVVSHTKVETSSLDNLYKEGNWFDCIRHFCNPPENIYTWWSYRSPDFTKNNRGRRLDHIWVSSNLSKKVVGASILKEARKMQRPSDHVPLVVEIID
tara:strand:- start:1891 stop:2664 length:774 start_codon:yes stop_codon:yes gene_type:complete